MITMFSSLAFNELHFPSVVFQVPVWVRWGPCKMIYSSVAAGHDGARPLSQASTSTGPSKCNKKKIYLVGETQGKETQELGLRAGSSWNMLS